MPSIGYSLCNPEKISLESLTVLSQNSKLTAERGAVSMRYSWLLLFFMLLGGAGLMMNDDASNPSSDIPGSVSPPSVVPENSGITAMMIGVGALFVLGSKRALKNKMKKVV